MRALEFRSTSRLYRSWWDAKQRCYNTKRPSYPDYGGRGISMFEEWVDDSQAFCRYITEELGERPEGCTLDRIDNDGNYEPGNLRWATRHEQNLNRRMDNINTNRGEDGRFR